jgi:hypothetical protein
MTAELERKIARLERTQHGLITIDQLRALDVSPSMTQRRVGGARHDRIANGVLATPSVVVTFEQRVMAAVLTAGDGAYASHESGAQLWDVLTTVAALIEITSGLDRRPRVKGVTCHRSGHAGDVTVLRGIPVTTPERTIVDLSGRLDLRSLGRMVDEALRRKLTTPARLREATTRLCPAPGRSLKKMVRILNARDERHVDRESLLEDFVYESIARFDLPLPVPQHRVTVEGRERRIDLSYPERMCALEAKGFDRRRDRERFDDDALRENELLLLGWSVLTFTSAFSDWKIASQVARQLGLPVPARPRKPLSFIDWARKRT